MNIKKLNTNEKLLIVKAIADITTNIYKDNNAFLLNRVLETEEKQIVMDYGKFYKQAIPEKTVQNLIDKNNEKIAELQAENERLNKYSDKTLIIVNQNIKLMSKHNEEGDGVANDLLKDLIAEFKSKKLEKSQMKIANQ